MAVVAQIMGSQAEALPDSAFPDIPDHPGTLSQPIEFDLNEQPNGYDANSRLRRPYPVGVCRACQQQLRVHATRPTRFMHHVPRLTSAVA